MYIRHQDKINDKNLNKNNLNWRNKKNYIKK